MIDSFKGEFRFLSNFFPSKVELDGLEYATVEHAYQAAKTLDPMHRLYVERAATPAAAKKLGRTLSIRPDWEAVKVEVMFGLVRQKFADPDLGRLLLSTWGHDLVEGNTWGDVFWGVCRGAGQNYLGRVLMTVRQDLADL